MKTILLFDTETQGTDPTQHRIVEIAMCRWSVEHRCAIESRSMLVQRDANPAEAVNRIPVGALGLGVTPDEALRELVVWFAKVDAVVAHNAAFDAAFVPEPVRSSRPWVCTLEDFDWPPGPRNLSALALGMGLSVDGSSLHRAGADVDLLRRMFERLEDPALSLARAMRPRARFVANEPRERNGDLKAAGFRWDPDRRQWWRRMAREDVAGLGLRVTEAE